MTLGPVQMLVLSFDRPDFSGRVLAELERLRESDLVRVIDLLVVHKDADGGVERLHHPDVAADGAVVEALLSQEPDGDDVWSLDDAIPADSAAAIALVEHRWAIGMREAIRAAGGVAVADAWIHPADLAAAGLAAEDAASPDG